jgi:hypothetical protein
MISQYPLTSIGDARMLAEDFGGLVHDRRRVRPDIILVEIEMDAAQNGSFLYCGRRW